ncbi:unnamed protein product [Phaeothamnion confervicola]
MLNCVQIQNAYLKKGKRYQRLSCVRCVRLKRPCDGNKPTCQRCAQTGRHCHYATTHKRPHPSPGPNEAGAPALVAAAAVERVSFSASSAIGLTGVQQRYLQSFLACFGEMIPFGVAPSGLVAAIVDSPATASVGSSGDGGGGSRGFGSWNGGGNGSSRGNGSARDLLRQGTGYGVLAVGALLSGECTDPGESAALILRANLCMQRALEVEDLDRDGSNARGGGGGGGSAGGDGGSGGSDAGGEGGSSGSRGSANCGSGNVELSNDSSNDGGFGCSGGNGGYSDDCNGGNVHIGESGSSHIRSIASVSTAAAGNGCNSGGGGRPSDGVQLRSWPGGTGVALLSSAEASADFSPDLPTSVLLCVCQLLEALRHLFSGSYSLFEECLQYAIESFRMVQWGINDDNGGPNTVVADTTVAASVAAHTEALSAAAAESRCRLGAVLMIFQITGAYGYSENPCRAPAREMEPLAAVRRRRGRLTLAEAAASPLPWLGPPSSYSNDPGVEVSGRSRSALGILTVLNAIMEPNSTRMVVGRPGAGGVEFGGCGDAGRAGERGRFSAGSNRDAALGTAAAAAGSGSSSSGGDDVDGNSIGNGRGDRIGGDDGGGSGCGSDGGRASFGGKGDDAGGPSSGEVDERAMVALSQWCFATAVEMAAEGGGIFLLLVSTSLRNFLMTRLEYSMERSRRAAAAWNGLFPLLSHCPGVVLVVPAAPARFRLLAKLHDDVVGDSYRSFCNCWNTCQRNTGGILTEVMPPQAPLTHETIRAEVEQLNPFYQRIVRKSLEWNVAASAALAASATTSAAAGAANTAAAAVLL